MPAIVVLITMASSRRMPAALGRARWSTEASSPRPPNYRAPPVVTRSLPFAPARALLARKLNLNAHSQSPCEQGSTTHSQFEYKSIQGDVIKKSIAPTAPRTSRVLCSTLEVAGNAEARLHSQPHISGPCLFSFSGLFFS